MYNKSVNVSNSKYHCEFPKYVNNDTGLRNGRWYGFNNNFLPSQE